MAGEAQRGDEHSPCSPPCAPPCTDSTKACGSPLAAVSPLEASSPRDVGEAAHATARSSPPMLSPHEAGRAGAGGGGGGGDGASSAWPASAWGSRGCRGSRGAGEVEREAWAWPRSAARAVRGGGAGVVKRKAGMLPRRSSAPRRSPRGVAAAAMPLRSSVPAVGREGASVLGRLVGRLASSVSVALVSVATPVATQAGGCRASCGVVMAGVVVAGSVVAGVAAARRLAPAVARAAWPAGGSMRRGGGEAAEGGTGAWCGPGSSRAGAWLSSARSSRVSVTKRKHAWSLLGHTRASAGRVSRPPEAPRALPRLPGLPKL